MKKLTVVFCTFFLWAVSYSCAWAQYSIVINKETNQLTLYDDGSVVRVFPVATGRTSGLTPEGVFNIVNKLVNPYYAKKKIPGGSPKNPLGPRWMGLSVGGGSEYGIHGNNNPSSIGKYVSAGCIRLKNEDIIWLYDRIPVGTRVEIVNSPLNKIESNVNYTVFVDDRIISLNGKKPLIINGSCSIPVRPAIEAMGYSGDWIEAENRFDMHINRCTVSITPGSQIAKVNNQTVNMAEPAFSEGGTLYVHPDFFSKVLHGSIYSDGKGKVEITSPFKLLIDSGFICLP